MCFRKIGIGKMLKKAKLPLFHDSRRILNACLTPGQAGVLGHHELHRAGTGELSLRAQ
jgi:hypothetical protein